MRPRIYFDRQVKYWAVDTPTVRAAYWGSFRGAFEYVCWWWEMRKKAEREMRKKAEGK